MADQDKNSAIATEDRSAVIDETPISPSSGPAHIRADSLEKHLQRRPDPQELKDRHILLDTNAAPYAFSSFHDCSFAGTN